MNLIIKLVVNFVLWRILEYFIILVFYKFNFIDILFSYVEVFKRLLIFEVF